MGDVRRYIRLRDVTLSVQRQAGDSDIQFTINSVYDAVVGAPPAAA